MEDIEGYKEILITQLNAAKGQENVDSPVFQLIEGWIVSHNPTHEKTDAFRKLAIYENDTKEDLFKARNESKSAMVALFKKCSL